MTNTAKLPKFPAFNRFACAGDSVEVYIGPLTVRATLQYDEDATLDDDDVHRTDPDHDVWEGSPPGVYEQAMEAREEYERGGWFYGGVVLSVMIEDTVLDKHAASLWGMEVNYPTRYDEEGEEFPPNAHLADVSDEMLDEALRSASVHVRAHFSRMRTAFKALEEVMRDAR